MFLQTAVLGALLAHAGDLVASFWFNFSRFGFHVTFCSINFGSTFIDWHGAEFALQLGSMENLWEIYGNHIWEGLGRSESSDLVKNFNHLVKHLIIW